ncbi:MAG TPA: hypothetical protein VI603_19485 [Saprospiraceae bacterium]|nr:hypothetical protein [Saprospiraceae bacterium]
MKKTITFLTKGNAILSLILTGFFLLMGLHSSTAQESAQGTLNPYTHIGAKLDVTAYPLGTFERDHAMDVLQQILTGLKPLLSNGGGTLTQRLRYNFCNKVLADISDNYIATEISLLTSLSALTAENSSTEIQQAQLRSLYGEIVNQLQ